MKSQRAYWIAFALCAAASAVPFLVTYRMPMTDLPEHAAQLTIWKHYDDSCYGFAQLYYKDWFTPYLVGYAIARLFAIVLSVNAALKLTAYCAVVALPLSLRVLLRRASTDDFLSLLGFPLAFGFSFYYGFLNFIVAVPLGMLFVACSFDYTATPTKRRAATLVALSLLLLASHALVYAFCLTIAIAMQIAARRSNLLPYVLSMPPAVAWVVRVDRHEPTIRLPVRWLEVFTRPANFLWRLLGSGWDPLATVFALLFAAAVYLIGVRPATDRRRWVPLILALLCYFALPSQAFGTAALFERFAVFIAAFALFALDRRASRTTAAAHALIVFLTIIWMTILTIRFHRFARDAANFDRVVDALPVNARLLFLDVDPGSIDVPGVLFLHFEAYYQERKGGVIGRSFATHFPELIRYRRGSDPGVFLYLDWNPWMLDWNRDGAKFDWFLVRAPGNIHDAIFAGAPEGLDLQQHAGMWWLYARRNRPLPSHCVPFAPDNREATFAEKSPD